MTIDLFADQFPSGRAKQGGGGGAAPTASHVEIGEGGVGAGEQRVAQAHAVARGVGGHVGEERRDHGVRGVQPVRRPRVVERDVDAAGAARSASR